MQVIRNVSVLILGGSLISLAQKSPSTGQGNATPPPGNASPQITRPSIAPANRAALPAVPAGAINTRSVSLQEAIDLALQHNFDVQIQRYLPELSGFSLQGAYGSYDPVLFASGQHSYNRSPGGLNPFDNTIYAGPETEADTFSTGLSGLLPTGLNYNLTGNASDSISTRPFESPVAVATANAAVAQLRQPLLRNFWIDPVRATIQISKNRLKYSEEALRLQLMTTVAQVEQAYYNLIFARENVKVQETALQLAERLLWENKKKVEVGQLAPLDEKQAESQVAASRADLLVTQRVLDAQENTLKSLITDNFVSWHDVRLIPAENLVAVPPLLNLQESWDRALRLRPDLAQARLDVKRSEITVRLDKNQLFPQLDLIGQYGYAGRDREFNGAFGQIRERDNPYWYYGASISWPLGNRVARSNYRAAKAQRAQSELILRQREQEALISVDDAVKLVQTDFARVEATREARLFAEAALDAEQKKLENGKSTSFFVLQFQRDLTAARFQEIQALAEYNNALAQLAFQEGSTFDRHRLNIEVK